MAKDRFSYEHDGKPFEVAHWKDIPIGAMRKLRGASDIDAAFGVVEAVCDEDTLAVVDTMTVDEFNVFYVAWQEASGITLGESEASSST